MSTPSTPDATPPRIIAAVLEHTAEYIREADWNPDHDDWNVTAAIWAASGNLVADPYLTRVVGQAAIDALGKHISFTKNFGRHLTAWSYLRRREDILKAIAELVVDLRGQL